MKKDLSQEIEIPEGIEASIENNSVSVKGNDGENKRLFNVDNIIFDWNLSEHLRVNC